MYKLFTAFEQNDIKYLHFKSNTNLSDSFCGKGDFDVLVDKAEIVKVEELILAHNGKRHNTMAVGNYVGVDNWLVFDELSGIIYHLHLHYQLVTGKQFVKDYVIPWNNLLFATRIKDSEFGLFITKPSVELILLAFRIVLKAKFFDYLKKLTGTYRLSKAMQKEWDDLSGKSSECEIRDNLKMICHDNNVEKVTNILCKTSLSTRDYLFLHRFVVKVMKPYKRYSTLMALIKTFKAQSEYKIERFWNKRMNGDAITKKISLQGGLIIAFVGVDGSGKSTVSNDIFRWIAKKIECKRYYMGTGDGKTTMLVSIINGIFNLTRNKKKTVEKAGKKTHDIDQKHRISFFSNPKSFINKNLKVCMISSVQKNNYSKIRKMHKYRLNGGISILDRWPQIEYAQQNDGPKLSYYSDILSNRKAIQRKVEKEKRYLGIVNTIKPDIIFRLNISLDTCMNRKSEHTDKELFENKIHELSKLTFQGAPIVEVDAEQPYHEELLFIKKTLWKYI